MSARFALAVLIAAAACCVLPAKATARTVPATHATGVWRPFRPVDRNELFTDLAMGPDGAVWLSNPSQGLVRVDRRGRRASYAMYVVHLKLRYQFYPTHIVWSGRHLYATGCFSNQCYAVAIVTPGHDGIVVWGEYSEDETTAGLSAVSDGSIFIAEQNRLGHVSAAGTESDRGYGTGEATNAFSGLTITRDGTIWFTEFDRDAIGRFFPKTGVTIEYPLGAQGISCLPTSLTAGPANGVYAGCGSGFIELHASGAAELFSTGYQPSSGPHDVTYGPGPFLWVSALRVLERFNPAQPSVTIYPAPPGEVTLYGATTGPDGKLWVLSQDGTVYIFEPSHSVARS